MFLKRQKQQHATAPREWSSHSWLDVSPVYSCSAMIQAKPSSETKKHLEKGRVLGLDVSLCKSVYLSLLLDAELQVREPWSERQSQRPALSSCEPLWFIELELRTWVSMLNLSSYLANKGLPHSSQVSRLGSRRVVNQISVLLAFRIHIIELYLSQLIPITAVCFTAWFATNISHHKCLMLESGTILQVIRVSAGHPRLFTESLATDTIDASEVHPRLCAWPYCLNSDLDSRNPKGIINTCVYICIEIDR